MTTRTARQPQAPVGTMAPARTGTLADHRSWSAALMVFAGGALGTVARESLDLLTPADRLVYTTFAINLLGSFALAVAYTALQARHTGAVAARRVRLLAGTGFLGGFTTYGSFAVATVVAGSHGSVGDAVLYAVGSLLLGAIAALLGRWVVERLTRSARATPLADQRAK
ncbi:fluoride efflux transporter FluC [Herbiconiux daphne]|uniref:Fluoride-specific ion channel FluC n=1 Tax=Herbiconiux daphne TaxID=2970914 RepID=A0ABT2GXV4_9MICO|nr:CrcB family protein [Herbiconiux daphne]MCS5732788.1 CrcB family protein [Herbiconiux daphne]